MQRSTGPRNPQRSTEINWPQKPPKIHWATSSLKIYRIMLSNVASRLLRVEMKDVGRWLIKEIKKSTSENSVSLESPNATTAEILKQVKMK
jgi:hypothetical protein